MIHACNTLPSALLPKLTTEEVMKEDLDVELRASPVTTLGVVLWYWSAGSVKVGEAGRDAPGSLCLSLGGTTEG